MYVLFLVVDAEHWIYTQMCAIILHQMWFVSMCLSTIYNRNYKSNLHIWAWILFNDGENINRYSI